MRPQVVEVLRCPACRAGLSLEAGEGVDIEAGSLSCVGCLTRYAIEDGVPRLLPPGQRAAAEATARTAAGFGYLWSRSLTEPGRDAWESYHFDRMAQRLSLAPVGRVLDAGCGEGIDLANQARRPGLEVVGVELSAEGCRASRARVRGLPSATVIQADLRVLPLANDLFDFIYSYGVLHHVTSPDEALRELVRVLKPGAKIAVYLYEDFSERAVPWRWLLRLSGACRALTTRLPADLLYRLCQAGSPVVFLLFAVPFRALRRVPMLERVAAGMPFRHARGPLRLANDLYDRFSAPIEKRYSRAGAVQFLRGAGLEQIALAQERGWMAVGTKPATAGVHDELIDASAHERA